LSARDMLSLVRGFVVGVAGVLMLC